MIADPGLKAHQTLCVWASGSLDVSSRANLILSRFCKRKEKKSGKKKQQGKKESLIYEPLLVMQLYTLQFTRIELILMVSDLPILNYNNSLFIL
jgi:hypothetical protein